MKRRITINYTNDNHEYKNFSFYVDSDDEEDHEFDVKDIDYISSELVKEN